MNASVTYAIVTITFLIIGQDTGSIVTDGISATRLEYREAIRQFQKNKSPKILALLRAEVETAMNGEAYGKIDNPQHLKSFIKEVQEAEGPSFLTRFRDLSDILRTLDAHFNLGRNLKETLTRHSLVSEFAFNLSLMVNRNDSSLFPRHRYMEKEREQIKEIDKDNEHLITKDFGNHLGLALLTNQVSGFRSKVMERSLEEGVFLKFDPQLDRVCRNTYSYIFKADIRRHFAP